MKKILIIASLMSVTSMMADEPWKFTMKSEAAKTTLKLDLYEESVEVPQMDMFGPMNGYLSGNVYGIWMITSSEIVDKTRAKIRLSNDFGSETQEANLTLIGDSICKMELKGGVVIKRVEGKKLVKVNSVMEFKKQK